MKKLITLCCVAATYCGFSQTTSAPAAPTAPAEKEWDVSWYGFIRTDYIWDSRKSAQVREYNLNLYPLDEVLDVNGADLNDTGASNFLSVVSRLGTKVKGPNVWGAKISGTLEGDFFGNTEASVGLLRLRHAYINMDWSKTSLIMGQTWYPTFIPEVFPGVANFSTGIMFNPFGWASQVRIKQNFTKEFSGALTAYKEREFTTASGTNAATNPTTDWSQNSASINSAIPTLHGQLQFKNKNWIAGLGAEYKSLQPLTKYNNIVTTETVNSTSVVGYFKYSNDKFSVKAYGITGKNMYNLVMLGGFTGYITAGQPMKFE
ncbi:MAG: DcaP family trimeric outer membrane transporter, partial [Flavobacterium sp.]